MLYSHILQSWFANGDSERLSDYGCYSFLPSLSLQGSAQDIPGKKTNCDTDSTVHLGHCGSSSWSICTDTRGTGEHRLLLRCCLGSPGSPLSWTPAALTLNSHIGLFVIHDSALWLHQFMFIYSTGTQLQNISCEESTILAWCVCMFPFFLTLHIYTYTHMYVSISILFKKKMKELKETWLIIAVRRHGSQELKPRKEDRTNVFIRTLHKYSSSFLLRT